MIRKAAFLAIVLFLSTVVVSCSVSDGSGQENDKAANLEEIASGLEYSQLGEFINGVAVAGSIENGANSKYGFVDKNGGSVIPFEYDDVRTFYEGVAAVKKSNEWMLIDGSGNTVKALDCDTVFGFTEGLAAILKDGKWGYIDLAGEMVVQPKYDGVSAFQDGLALVYNVENTAGIESYKTGFIDKTGKEVIPLEYENEFIQSGLQVYMGFREGLAAVQQNDKWGYLNPEGGIVIPFEYDRAHAFYDGIAYAEKDGKKGFIDKTGNFVIIINSEYAIGYDNPPAFNSELLFTADKNGKYGYIDKTGTVVIEFKYDMAFAFSEGLAAVRKNDKWGYIDETGKEVIPFVYDNTYGFKSGAATVQKDGKEGLINKNGEVILPIEYNIIRISSEGLVSAQNKATMKWSVLETK